MESRNKLINESRSQYDNGSRHVGVVVSTIQDFKESSNQVINESKTHNVNESISQFSQWSQWCQ
jgi:hypothetical protein